MIPSIEKCEELSKFLANEYLLDVIYSTEKVYIDCGSDHYEEKPSLREELPFDFSEYGSTLFCPTSKELFKFLDNKNWLLETYQSNWKYEIKSSNWLSVSTRLNRNEVEFSDYLQLIETDDNWNIILELDFEENESFIDNLIDMIIYLFQNKYLVTTHN